MFEGNGSLEKVVFFITSLKSFLQISKMKKKEKLQRKEQFHFECSEKQILINDLEDRCRTTHFDRKNNKYVFIFFLLLLSL